MSVTDIWPPKRPGPVSDRDSVSVTTQCPLELTREGVRMASCGRAVATPQHVAGVGAPGRGADEDARTSTSASARTRRARACVGRRDLRCGERWRPCHGHGLSREPAAGGGTAPCRCVGTFRAATGVLGNAPERRAALADGRLHHRQQRRNPAVHGGRQGLVRPLRRRGLARHPEHGRRCGECHRVQTQRRQGPGRRGRLYLSRRPRDWRWRNPGLVPEGRGLVLLWHRRRRHRHAVQP